MSPRAARLLHPLAALLALGAASCLERPAVPVTPNLQAGIRLPLTGQGIDEVDILLEIDNSNSMAGNQERLANNLEHMVELFFAVTQGAMSPIRSLRVGVITSDLGTLGVGLFELQPEPGRVAGRRQRAPQPLHERRGDADRRERPARHRAARGVRLPRPGGAPALPRVLADEPEPRRFCV